MAARLRRADPNGPGWSRRRHGRGFRYLDAQGCGLPPEDAQRCRQLAIPPAWTDVWICPWPNGHLQAVGTDAAGRRQYLYHPAWRQWRDEVKFERVLGFGRALPTARATVAEHLSLPGMPRQRALAAGFRLLDRAGLRVGGEAYAEANGTVGAATLRLDHVRTRGDRVLLRFPGKGGKEHDIVVRDAELVPAIRAMRARRTGEPELLAWRDDAGWHDVSSVDLNEYVREVTGCESSAKDFRTWQAAVRALAVLATVEPQAPRKKAVAAAMQSVSEHLGNTPAMARNAYVHPTVVEAFLAGRQLPVPDAIDDGSGDGSPEETRADADNAALVAEVEAWESALLALLESDAS
jgi:DNA topoisomerase IB